MKDYCPECGSENFDGEPDEYQPSPWEVHSTGTCLDCGAVVHFIHDSPRLDAAIEEMEMNGGRYDHYSY